VGATPPTSLAPPAGGFTPPVGSSPPSSEFSPPAVGTTPPTGGFGPPSGGFGSPPGAFSGSFGPSALDPYGAGCRGAVPSAGLTSLSAVAVALLLVSVDVMRISTNADTYLD
jgi:glucan endo-1,3-beta-glucosidase 4